MINRPFRLIIGLLIIVLQYLHQLTALYILTAVLILEPLSGWRLSNTLMRLKNKDAYTRHQQYLKTTPSRFKLEAERVAIFVVGLSLAIVYVLPALGLIAPDSTALFVLGFLPWGFGFALVATSFVNACPMVIMFKEMGFK